ncbi:MAG: hypothetical protein ACFCA4_12655 [Cyanophyceae cyanobacterium]
MAFSYRNGIETGDGVTSHGVWGLITPLPSESEPPADPLANATSATLLVTIKQSTSPDVTTFSVGPHTFSYLAEENAECIGTILLGPGDPEPQVVIGDGVVLNFQLSINQ